MGDTEDEQYFYAQAMRDFVTFSAVECEALPCGESAPNASVVPCDAKSLRLYDAKAGKVVECDGPASADSPLSADDSRRLGDHDLLYEAVCDPPHSTEASPDYIDLLVSGLTEPEPCPENGHPYLQRTGPGGSDNDVAPALTVHRIFAPEYRTPANGWISEFWDFSDRFHEHEVRLESCGIRTSGTPVDSLTGIVRAYAKQDYEVSIGLPPLRQVQRSRSATRRRGGETVSTSSSSTRTGRSGRAESETTTENLGDGRSHTERTSVVTDSDGGSTTRRSEQGFDAQEGDSAADHHSTSQQSGTALRRTATQDRITGREAVSYEIEPGIVLKHNGQSINATEKINQILNYAREVKEFWDDLQNWVPQIGWSFRMDLAFLEGSIAGRWGLRPVPSTSDRIVAVDKHFEFDIDIKLISFAVTLSLGVDIGNVIAGATGTIAGSINLALSARGRIVTNGARSCTVTPTATVSLTGTVRACIAGECQGYTATVALTVAGSGTMAVTDDTPLRCTASITLSRGALVITRIDGRRSRGVLGSPITLFDAQPIWEGELL